MLLFNVVNIYMHVHFNYPINNIMLLKIILYLGSILAHGM